LNVTPVSPNLNLNLVIGLFAGLGAVAVAVLLKDMLYFSGLVCTA
jgi:uncharacterized protein involved in exopolysaccharide biosynthesis